MKQIKHTDKYGWKTTIKYYVNGDIVITQWKDEEHRYIWLGPEQVEELKKLLKV